MLLEREQNKNAPDDELYAAFLAGDTGALDTLMLRHRQRLTAYCNAFAHNVDDAEDLAMETFARLMAKRPGIRAGCFRAYLYRMARNLALRFLHRRDSLVFLPEDEELPDAGDMESRVADGEERRILRRCLDRVEPDAREALWLVYFEDMSYEQAAAVTKTNVRKIEYRVSKGKRLLRAELLKEGITDAHG